MLSGCRRSYTHALHRIVICQLRDLQSSGFLDLYTQDEVAELIGLATEEQNANKSPASRPIDRAAIASLYLMLAIGCQVRGGSRDDLVLASKYFNQGRQIAFEKMLEDPTINLARAFILLAFYMFGACRRNSAFMYLGVAAKSADILGLHAAAKHKHTSKAEQDSRSVILCLNLLPAFRITLTFPIPQTQGGQEYQSLRHHMLFNFRKTR